MSIKRVLVLLSVVLLVEIFTATNASASIGNIANGGRFNRCLGIRLDSHANGAAATIGDCDTSDTQLWSVRATAVVGGKFGYQYENFAHKCLGVRGGSTVSTILVQGMCGPTSDHSQIWRPVQWGGHGWVGFAGNPGDGWFHLMNGHSGLCMGLQGSNPTGGVAVIQGACDQNSDTQVWFARSGL
jgi:hypothetical protein